MSNILGEPLLVPLSELNTILSPFADHAGEKSEKVSLVKFVNSCVSISTTYRSLASSLCPINTILF